MRRLTTLLLLSGALAWALPTPSARADGDAPRVRHEVFDEVWETVRRNLFDPKMRGLEWPALRLKYRERALAAKHPEELHAVIQELLGELGCSHLSLIEGDVYAEHVASEFTNTRVPTMGLDLVELPQGLFVAAVADGGAADEAGLRRGDRILAIDELDPAQSPLLRPAGSDPGLPGPRGFYLSPKAGLALTIERRPEAGEKGVFKLNMSPKEWNLIAATEASISVEERCGLRWGRIHLWHLAHLDVVKALDKALRGPFRDCNGLLLDLRGRGGTPENVDRVLELFDPSSPFGARWRRPVVAIIDGGTRSAKEVLAFHLARDEAATLIGQRTQGAVLGARFFRLRDGSQLMIPIVDMRAMTHGVSLEGNGVEPDIAVEDELPWADGRDPMLERAREELFWILRKHLRKGRVHGWY